VGVVEQSSIQRFLINRASQLAASRYGRQAWVWHVAIGVSLVGLGLGMALAGALAGISGLLFGGLGPIIGGAINLFLGLRVRRKVQESPTEPKLSPEATQFVQSLMHQTHSGWNSSQGYTAIWKSGPSPNAPSPLSSGETIFHQLGKQWGIIPKTPKDILPKPLYDLLETACFHYNRIHGMLEGGREEVALAKIAQSARLGADEAMFAVLHHAAMMHRFPETISASSRDCEGKIRALKELADGLEKIQTRPAPISDRLSYSSAMDSALEEMRLERLAREELGRHSNGDEQLRERL
jgi:hypothetical protein